MKSDTLIRIEGMEALMEKLGLVEAERFIMLVKKEPFDYTQWREDQFDDKSIETIFAEAAALRAETESRKKKSVTQSNEPQSSKKKQVGKK